MNPVSTMRPGSPRRWSLDAPRSVELRARRCRSIDRNLTFDKFYPPLTVLPLTCCALSRGRRCPVDRVGDSRENRAPTKNWRGTSPLMTPPEDRTETPQDGGAPLDPALRDALRDLERHVVVGVRNGRPIVLAGDGTNPIPQRSASTAATTRSTRDSDEVDTAIAPPCPISRLGDVAFCRDHGLRFPYISGSMANGIGSSDIAEAMGRAGMLGFFGAAGLSLADVEKTIDRLQESLGDLPYGFNLIHTPSEPRVERDIVELYLRRQVRRIEASAFLDLTLPLLRYRLHGIEKRADGGVYTPNRIVGKASRIEVASKFFAPPPEAIVAELIRSGDLTPEQAEWAKEVPVVQDLTAEADSGGHTDNRPALTLLPTFLQLRDRQMLRYRFRQPLRVGAAGGIATPQAAAAAFSLGAAYVVVGSVHQACRESGSSDLVRAMLAEAEQADITMAPAPDMFEMGVKVQVLKRGTLFAMRGAKLYELYRTYDGLDAIPAKERAFLESKIFRAPLDDIWQQTRDYFLERDPRQAERAEADPKHKMALVFRWYLGLASRWANSGVADRKIDYQVWCGPAMGAFNEWVRGSFLEAPDERRVVVVALNILYGAALQLRLTTLRCQGIDIPLYQLFAQPLPLCELEPLLGRLEARV